MVHGPKAGIELLDTLRGDARLADHYRLMAVRAHMHEIAGDLVAAAADYLAAARRTTSVPEREYLAAQAAKLSKV
jgi:predicted RNA polymerase sigma factor